MRGSTALGCVAWLVGCGGHAADFATTPRFADVPRQVPGVAIDRATELPRAGRAGQTDSGLVVLQTPAAPEAALNVVRAFFQAAVAELPEKLSALLSEQAVVNIAGGRQPASAFWRSRLLQLDYTQLSGQLLFRDADVETYRAADLSELPPSRRIPIELGEADLALRVPLSISWMGRTRLFADELVFRLQPSARSYQIAEIAEDFRLP